MNFPQHKTGRLCACPEDAEGFSGPEKIHHITNSVMTGESFTNSCFNRKLRSESPRSWRA